LAFEAGAGAQVSLRIGGKVGPLSGDPLDLPCVVKALHPDLIMTGLANSPTSMGRSALVESAGIEIALVTVRVQAMGTDLFTNLGCRLEDKKLIVVKSSQHFYADFSKIARRVLYVSGPGTLTSDLSTLPYRKVRRPKWPLDPSS
jgi:microcystin degradation protein MlrC